LLCIESRGAVGILQIAHQPPLSFGQHGTVIVGDPLLIHRGAERDLERVSAAGPGHELRIRGQRKVGKGLGKLRRLGGLRLRVTG
jgi:hypothetical protein